MESKSETMKDVQFVEESQQLEKAVTVILIPN